jgi:hypothetical protein
MLFCKLYYDNSLDEIFQYILETEQTNIYELLENYYNLADYILEKYNIDIYDINFKHLKALKKIRLIKLKI